MTYNRSMRVALVHDWLTGMRGGERCLEVFCELFPHADLFTLLHVPGSVSPTIEGRRIVTSFIQRLPAAATRYRQYLPLMPAAVGRFDCPGLRSGAVLQPLRGQGRPPRAREPARVLLLHPDALRLGPLRGLRRRPRQPRHPSGPAGVGPGSARVGPSGQSPRASLRGHLRARAGSHPPLLRAGGDGHLSARRRPALRAGRRPRGRLLSRRLRPRALQAHRSGHPRGGRAAAATPDRGDRARGGAPARPSRGRPSSSSAGAATRRSRASTASAGPCSSPAARTSASFRSRPWPPGAR